VCSVCGSWEGSLTTDCPGQGVGFDKRQEVYETTLDYTDERGWHLSDAAREPRFESTKVPPPPPRSDPRVLVAPTIDWAAVDRTENLRHELSKKAIAWVLADRLCEERSAALAQAQDAARPLSGKTDLDANDRVLLARLEQEGISFKIACRRVEQYDEEFRQAARLLVAALEASAVVRSSNGA
jgi:hypothetical protein